MMRSEKKLVFAMMLLVVGLFLTISTASAKGNFKKASDFTMKSLSGKNIKLSEQRGRVVILNFWATWCTPCKEELPYFNALYGKYKGVGLEILGVNIDKRKGAAMRMSQDLGIDFPVLPDPSGKVSGLYLIRSMPTTYVIAKDGTIRNIHWGFGPQDAASYEKEVRSLLKE